MVHCWTSKAKSQVVSMFLQKSRLFDSNNTGFFFWLTPTDWLSPTPTPTRTRNNSDSDAYVPDEITAGAQFPTPSCEM